MLDHSTRKRPGSIRPVALVLLCLSLPYNVGLAENTVGSNLEKKLGRIAKQDQWYFGVGLPVFTGCRALGGIRLHRDVSEQWQNKAIQGGVACLFTKNSAGTKNCQIAISGWTSIESKWHKPMLWCGVSAEMNSSTFSITILPGGAAHFKNFGLAVLMQAEFSAGKPWLGGMRFLFKQDLLTTRRWLPISVAGFAKGRAGWTQHDLISKPFVKLGIMVSPHQLPWFKSELSLNLRAPMVTAEKGKSIFSNISVRLNFARPNRRSKLGKASLPVLWSELIIPARESSVVANGLGDDYSYDYSDDDSYEGTSPRQEPTEQLENDQDDVLDVSQKPAAVQAGEAELTQPFMSDNDPKSEKAEKPGALLSTVDESTKMVCSTPRQNIQCAEVSAPSFSLDGIDASLQVRSAAHQGASLENVASNNEFQAVKLIDLANKIECANHSIETVASESITVLEPIGKETSEEVLQALTVTDASEPPFYDEDGSLEKDEIVEKDFTDLRKGSTFLSASACNSEAMPASEPTDLQPVEERFTKAPKVPPLTLSQSRQTEFCVPSPSQLSHASSSYSADPVSLSSDSAFPSSAQPMNVLNSAWMSPSGESELTSYVQMHESFELENHSSPCSATFTTSVQSRYSEKNGELSTHFKAGGLANLKSDNTFFLASDVKIKDAPTTNNPECSSTPLEVPRSNESIMTLQVEPIEKNEIESRFASPGMTQAAPNLKSEAIDQESPSRLLATIKSARFKSTLRSATPHTPSNTPQTQIVEKDRLDSHDIYPKQIGAPTEVLSPRSEPWLTLPVTSFQLSESYAGSPRRIPEFPPSSGPMSALSPREKRSDSARKLLHAPELTDQPLFSKSTEEVTAKSLQDPSVAKPSTLRQAVSSSGSTPDSPRGEGVTSTIQSIKSSFASLGNTFKNFRMPSFSLGEFEKLPEPYDFQASWDQVCVNLAKQSLPNYQISAKGSCTFLLDCINLPEIVEENPGGETGTLTRALTLLGEAISNCDMDPEVSEIICQRMIPILVTYHLNSIERESRERNEVWIQGRSKDQHLLWIQKMALAAGQSDSFTVLHQIFTLSKRKIDACKNKGFFPLLEAIDESLKMLENHPKYQVLEGRLVLKETKLRQADLFAFTDFNHPTKPSIKLHKLKLSEDLNHSVSNMNLTCDDDFFALISMSYRALCAENSLRGTE